MYYTYGHIRPDTGVIFYVGQGSRRRARSRDGRNPHWRKVVFKNNGKFDIIIFNWFNNLDDALASEIWQIAKLSHEGNLVNKTPGGDCGRPGERSDDEKKQTSISRRGKAIGDANPMRKPEQKGIFVGLKNCMSKYEFREKHYSNNKTKGSNNGMYGKVGDKNPAFGKPSAMRGKKNLGLAWVAECKKWQRYWGA